MSRAENEHPGIPTRRLRTSGFTLMELLVTIAIIGILSMVAVFSIRSGRGERAISEHSSNIVNTFKEARSRAVSNGRRYAVRLTPTSVQWCENDCPPNQPNTPGIEIGKVHPAVNGAQVVSFSRTADIGVTPLPARTVLTSTVLYFLPNGSVDSDITTPQLEGFTAYLQHDTQERIKYRIAILPLSADIRTFHSWDE
ncbi:MAG: prepilin-type N-terminal cleavage/methylation domain-containing protein [bacterium]